MFSKKVKHHNSFGIFALRMVAGLVLFGENNILLKKSTQKIWILPHYLERFYELIRLYPFSLRQLKSVISRFGYPTSDFYKQRFNEEFTDTDKESLFESYSAFDEMYTSRLMLAYNRADFIAPYLDLFQKKEVQTVLDYGAGVSDTGLILANKGCSIDIVDLDTRKIYFTQKRFQWRGFDANIYPVASTEIMAEVPKKYDLIIATEILEHYRYPLQMVNWFYDHLNEGGLLLLSMGRYFEHEHGGDHLEEAFEEGMSDEYNQNFDRKFKEYNGFETLFQKKTEK